MKIMVTGASGFVGCAVLRHLISLEREVFGVVRKVPLVNDIDSNRFTEIGDITESTEWSHKLKGVSAVVHCAARVHVMNEPSDDPSAVYRQVNTEGTLKLAREAAATGVKRFVFLSSIKVNGEETSIAKPFFSNDKPSPTDPYGISKMEAEEGLKKLAAETEMEVVIIRPVLVYGPGVKANFHNMMSWLHKGVPLPFGAIHNKRSLVALDNLVDLIVTCIDHPSAANQTFLVSDDEDLSTTDLLRRMGNALGKPTRLLPVPVSLLNSVARLCGKRNLADRLLNSLIVDTSYTSKVLNWKPPVKVDEALFRTAKYFLEHNTK